MSDLNEKYMNSNENNALNFEFVSINKIWYTFIKTKNMVGGKHHKSLHAKRLSMVNKR